MPATPPSPQEPPESLSPNSDAQLRALDPVIPGPPAPGPSTLGCDPTPCVQINRVATQMVVEREHANRPTFTPGAGWTLRPACLHADQPGGD